MFRTHQEKKRCKVLEGRRRKTLKNRRENNETTHAGYTWLLDDSHSSLECRTQAGGRNGDVCVASTAEVLLSETGGKTPTQPGTERQRQRQQIVLRGAFKGGALPACTSAQLRPETPPRENRTISIGPELQPEAS